ncbi:caspase family protein, partial [Nocardia sp. NPDC004085]
MAADIGAGTAGPRRYLIATAVAEHVQAPQWNVPGLVQARSEMIDLFTNMFGYRHVTELGMNPTSTQLIRGLRSFCASKDRRVDDLVAVYIAAHGERLDTTGEHVILTADDNPEDVSGAMPTEYLARHILLDTPVRRLLLLLDTCYSGKGGSEFAAAALSSLTGHWKEVVGTGIVVVSSAQPMQWAEPGVFPRLFREAVESMVAASDGVYTLALDDVVRSMNTNSAQVSRQTILLTSAKSTGRDPDFLRIHDPAHTETDLLIRHANEWEAHAALRETEFLTQLLKRAKGSDKGWWFCGRHNALGEITRWLMNPERNRPLLAITGLAGSGKSAVLGLITTLTHPDYWDTVPIDSLGLHPGSIAPVGAIDVAIYAQGLTFEQVLGGIAAAAQVTADTVSQLLTQLRTRAKPLTVLIDALDEASEPELLTRELLQHVYKYGRGRVRLVVGTRPNLIANLDLPQGDLIDLDAPRYADMDALSNYTRRGLLESDPNSVYTPDQPNFLEVADAIAKAAAPSFLVAGITSAIMSADQRIPDPADPLWLQSLPRLPGEAMQHDLQARLGDDADRARDLLRPLAFAEGQGLPWQDIWAPLASRIAGVPYTDHDLRWLCHHAGSYVAETTEFGRPVYRAHQQALTEYLRENAEDAKIHATFVEVLKTRIPRTPEGTRDWTRAHPYTLRHLATHAARAGLIDDLIRDLDYVVHADPSALLAALNTATTTIGRQIRAIYRCSAAIHRSLPPDRRRQVLATDAARFHATDQHHVFTRTLDWPPRWATGQHASHALRVSLNGHNRAVRAAAWVLSENAPVVVTASDDETATVWDLRTGELRATLKGHTGAVWAVACATVDKVPVAVTVSDDETARVWDLRTGELRATLKGHTGPVWAVACATVDKVPVAVTVSLDETAKVWDLRTGELRATLKGHTGAVWAVACATVDKVPVAVTVSLDETAKVWDLRTGELRATLQGHTGPVSAVACTTVDKVPVAVTGSYDRTVQLWDLRTGMPCATMSGHTAQVLSVACSVVDGEPITISTSVDQTAQVWNLRTHKRCAILLGHTEPVWTAACATVDDAPVTVTVSDDRTARVWDLRTGEPRALLNGHTNRVSAVICAVVDGQPVAVTSSLDETARVWDLEVSESTAHVGGHTDWVLAVACTKIDGYPVVVSTSLDNSIRVWDLASGELLVTLTGHTRPVSAVACANVDDTPIAITAGDEETVRVWDLGTG